jgi:hypothetical protein
MRLVYQKVTSKPQMGMKIKGYGHNISHKTRQDYMMVKAFQQFETVVPEEFDITNVAGENYN